MDTFGIFNVLAEFVGKNWAGVLVAAALMLSGVFGWYFKVILPDGQRFEGDGENADAERVRYLKWREQLTRGGTVTAVYDGLLVQALDRVDRFFGDEPLAVRGKAATWTGPALGRCLTLALIYPIMSLVVIWHITGLVGPAETALGFSKSVPALQRGASAASLIWFVLAFMWIAAPLDRYKTPMWRVVRFVLFASATTVAAKIVINVTSGIIFLGPITFATAITMVRASEAASAGAVAVAIAVSSAVAAAFAFAGFDTIVGAYVWVAVFLLAVAAQMMVFASGAAQRMGGTIRLVVTLSTFIVVYLALILGLVVWMTHWTPTTTKPEWTLLAFFGALPLINAFFDWLSLGLTRFLLRRGQVQGGVWPFLYALIDLASAVVMLVAVMAASLLFLNAMNSASLAGGGKTVLDIDGLIQDLRTDPGNPALWWIYVTVFSTFVPSLVNLMLGGLAVMRGIPGLPRVIVRNMLPENPARLTLVRRALASAGVTFQIGVAFSGALVVGFLVIGIVLKGLGYIGLGLVDIADWLV